MHSLLKLSLAAAIGAAVAVGCGSKDKQAKAPSSTETTSGAAGNSAPSDPSAQASQARRAQEQAEQQQRRQQQDEQREQQTTMGSAGADDTEPSSTTTTTQGTMGADANAKQDEKQAPVTSLSDGEVLAIESAINSGAVTLAEMARKKASHRDVKSFAASMVTEHRDAETKAKNIAKKEKITAAPSDVSKRLKTEATSTQADLTTRKGHDFDTAYIDTQVKMHRDDVELIDTQLMPSVKNAALKGHLETLRRTVADHLAKAQDLQSRLQTVGTTSTTSGTDEQDKTKAKGGQAGQQGQQEKQPPPKQP